MVRCRPGIFPPTRMLANSHVPFRAGRARPPVQMPKSKNIVHRASDRLVVFATEIGKGTVREGFRLGAQLADSFSAALIQIVSDNETYYAARRNRIHPGPEIVRRPREKLRSGFADLFCEDREDSRSESDGASSIVILPEASYFRGGGGNDRDCQCSDTASFMTERPLHRRIARSLIQSGSWSLARGRYQYCSLPSSRILFSRLSTRIRRR